jgi:hypothetical protein
MIGRKKVAVKFRKIIIKSIWKKIDEENDPDTMMKKYKLENPMFYRMVLAFRSQMTRKEEIKDSV